MLDRAVLQAPLLDHRGLDLAAARKVNYVLQQSFRYEYDAPVESLRQRLVIVPPARHGNQYRRAHLLEVNGAPARRRVSRDAYGNVVAWLHADRVTQAIEFRLAAVIERVRDDGPTLLPADTLMLALCHLVQLPARYVSGHLLGQGGTHAWVEVIVPHGQQAEAVAFDPCNSRRTDSGYVTVATGRDYSDVAPTSGSYVGTSSGRLTTDRKVGVLAAA